MKVTLLMETAEAIAQRAIAERRALVEELNAQIPNNQRKWREHCVRWELAAPSRPSEFGFINPLSIY